MQVLNLVVEEVALVDVIQALDVGVALVLEGRPVEGRRLLQAEAVGLGLVKGLGYRSGVESYFLRDTSAEMLAAVGLPWGFKIEEYPPNINTCPSQFLVLDNHSLSSELSTGHACGSQPSAAATDDEEVGLLRDRRHCV